MRVTIEDDRAVLKYTQIMKDVDGNDIEVVTNQESYKKNDIARIIARWTTERDRLTNMITKAEQIYSQM